MKEFDEQMEEVFRVSEVEYDSVNFVVGEKFSSYKQLSGGEDYCLPRWK